MPTVVIEEDGALAVIEPLPYPGTNSERNTIETNIVDVEQCEAIDAVGDRLYPCPLVRDHIGPHWRCTTELAAQIAPVRLWHHLDA